MCCCVAESRDASRRARFAVKAGRRRAPRWAAQGCVNRCRRRCRCRESGCAGKNPCVIATWRAVNHRPLTVVCRLLTVVRYHRPLPSPVVRRPSSVVYRLSSAALVPSSPSRYLFSLVAISSTAFTTRQSPTPHQISRCWPRQDKRQTGRGASTLFAHPLRICRRESSMLLLLLLLEKPLFARDPPRGAREPMRARARGGFV
jgi:hypothetical protein